MSLTTGWEPLPYMFWTRVVLKKKCNNEQHIVISDLPGDICLSLCCIGRHKNISEIITTSHILYEISRTWTWYDLPIGVAWLIRSITSKTGISWNGAIYIGRVKLKREYLDPMLFMAEPWITFILLYDVRCLLETWISVRRLVQTKIPFRLTLLLRIFVPRSPR